MGIVSDIIDANINQFTVNSPFENTSAKRALSWLYDNGVHYDQIVFNRRGDKLAVGPKFDVFVEDFLDEIKTITKAGIFTILFDQPWNQTSNLPTNCKRTYNWDDVLKMISGLE